MGDGGSYPKQYWWIVLVVVPILVTVIGGIMTYWNRMENKQKVIVVPPLTSKEILDKTSGTFKVKMRVAGGIDPETGEIVYEFDLFNTGDHIAVVKRITLEILDIELEKPVPPGPAKIGALLAKAKRHILLKHNRVGEYLITDEERKYGKGDIDKFVVGLKSDKPDWRYIFRIKIIWYDPEEEGERILYSEQYTARF